MKLKTLTEEGTGIRGRWLFWNHADHVVCSTVHANIAACTSRVAMPATGGAQVINGGFWEAWPTYLCS